MATFADILRCPTCKHRLAEEGAALHCAACDVTYQALDGLWDLLPARTSRLKLSEREHYSEKTGFYLDMHRTWSGSPFYRHYHQAFLDELRRLPAGSLILETGCGLGHDGLELLRSGYRLVETDIAPGHLGEARRLHLAEGYGASSFHLLADAESLPFPAACFDGALTVASLHHLPDPLRALRETRRVLKPGGLFVLGTEPNSWQSHTLYPVGKLLLELAGFLLRKQAHGGENVSEADKLAEGFSRRRLDGLFREAGFRAWTLKPAGYLSAAASAISVELSQLAGRNIRVFALERAAIPLDEALGRLPLTSRYPWHWNAVAQT